MKQRLFDDYLERHAKGISSYLDEVERRTNLESLQPHMISGKLQGNFLKIICSLLSPKRVLEIGTFTGYSALCFAEALGMKGEITTIECDIEVAEKAKINFQLSPYNDQIKLLVGDAKTILPDLLIKNNFDLIYIDADKQSNHFYYNLLIDKLERNKVILVDNVLWKGNVYDDGIQDPKTQSIREFNKLIFEDERVDAMILPIRDGIYLIRKK